MHPLVEARHVMAVSAQGGQLAGQLTGQAVQATPPGLGQLKGPPPDIMTPSSHTFTTPTTSTHIPHMVAGPSCHYPAVKSVQILSSYGDAVQPLALKRSCPPPTTEQAAPCAVP